MTVVFNMATEKLGLSLSRIVHQSQIKSHLCVLSECESQWVLHSAVIMILEFGKFLFKRIIFSPQNVYPATIICKRSF